MGFRLLPGVQAVAWRLEGSGLGLGLLLGCWGGCRGFEVVSGDMVIYRLSIQGSKVCFAWCRNQDEGLGMFCSLHLGVEGSRHYMGKFSLLLQTSWAGHFLWVSGWAVSLGLSLGSSLVLSLGSSLGLSSGSSLGLEQRDFGQGWSFKFELGQLP